MAGYWNAFTRIVRTGVETRSADDIVVSLERRATLERLAGRGIVLVAQETATLSLEPADGRRGRPSAYAGRVLFHPAVAMAVGGDPLGPLTEECRVDEDEAATRWIEIMREIRRVIPRETAAVLIGSPVGDVYAVFVQARERGVDLLMPAPRHVTVGDEWSDAAVALDPAAVLGGVTVSVPRDGSPLRRRATLALYSRKVLLTPSGLGRAGDAAAGIELSALRAVEPLPPHGASPVRWDLLTNLPAASVEQAALLACWYSYRHPEERVRSGMAPQEFDGTS